MGCSDPLPPAPPTAGPLRPSAAPARSSNAARRRYEARYAQVEREICRPATPGYMIQYQVTRPVTGSPLYVPCTLGVAVRLSNGRRGFLSAAHCSRYAGRQQGTPFFQPLVLNVRKYYLGAEYWDPGFTDTCYMTDPCRWIDALAGLWGTYGVDYHFGRIARPIGYGTYGTATRGYIEINRSKPTFRIVQEMPFPVGNEILDKVGQASGWTYGPVDRTCTNVRYDIKPTEEHPADYVIFMCQDQVAATGIGGDGGGPVFFYQGDNVHIAGILTGARQEGTAITGFSFSSMWNIEQDFGPLQTY